MVNAEVLPFDFKAFQKTLSTYVTEVTSLLDNLREMTEIEIYQLTIAILVILLVAVTSFAIGFVATLLRGLRELKAANTPPIVKGR